MNPGYKILQHRTKNLYTGDNVRTSDNANINFRNMKDSLMDPEYVNFFPSLYTVKQYILSNI